MFQLETPSTKFDTLSSLLNLILNYPCFNIPPNYLEATNLTARVQLVTNSSALAIELRTNLSSRYDAVSVCVKLVQLTKRTDRENLQEGFPSNCILRARSALPFESIDDQNGLYIGSSVNGL